MGELLGGQIGRCLGQLDATADLHTKLSVLTGSSGRVKLSQFIGKFCKIPTLRCVVSPTYGLPPNLLFLPDTRRSRLRRHQRRRRRWPLVMGVFAGYRSRERRRA